MASQKIPEAYDPLVQLGPTAPTSPSQCHFVALGTFAYVRDRQRSGNRTGGKHGSW